MEEVHTESEIIISGFTRRKKKKLTPAVNDEPMIT